jgi:hypothetical protein
MKKSIAILLVLVTAFVSAFAAETSTLNLSTSVTDVLVGKIVSVTDVPTVESYDETVAKGDQTFSASTLSADFVYVYKTNLTKAPTVTVTANALKSGSNVMKYTFNSTAVTVDATTVALLSATDDPNAATAGLRTIGKTFEVSIAEADFTKAPAGLYEATISIEVKAN